MNVRFENPFDRKSAKESVMSRCHFPAVKRSLLAGLCCLPGLAFAFNSGSTGADGAFSPTVNTQLELPPSGVYNFTTINIPAGVTVTFKKNTANTPVVWLASGDVTIAGNVNLMGGDSPAIGAGGNGNIGDDGLPGIGGPGGYDGGRGGPAGVNQVGGTGLGPGGGLNNTGTEPFGGGGAGFAAAGANARINSCGYSIGYNGSRAVGGPAYGSSMLLPLVGGSGGGGAIGATAFPGSGGGGGGGAILIASSATLTVSGQINAYGGASGAAAGGSAGGTGGGGSGGAIRLIATTIAGNGTINANGGSPGANSNNGCLNGGAGSVGRIRLEAESITRTAATTPAYTSGVPGPLFIASAPTLTISSVAGVNAPANPTGNADITLPATTPNPVTVVFNTTGVPPGNTIKLTVMPSYGDAVTATSPALTGSTASATASVSVNLPSGPSVMSAVTTYTIVAALGDAMSTFAQGERVEKIALAAVFGAPSKATLITVSGKEYPASSEALAMAGLNG